MDVAGALRVIVAEDDGAMRALLVGALRREGHAVEAVADGASLVAMVTAGGWDLVVTDEHMPGMNGLTAVAHLRGSGWSLPVLVVTSFGDPDVRERAAKLGDCEVLAKPVDLSALRGAVRRLAGRT